MACHGTKDHELDEKLEKDVISGAGTSKSSTSSQDDIERALPQEPIELYEDGTTYEGGVRHERPMLKRTASRASTVQDVVSVLERVLTTRSIAEPGPPPDGGWKAWSQVAAAWLVLFTTWGLETSHIPSYT